MPPAAQLPLLPSPAAALLPAPLGDGDAPLQAVALRNGGPAPLRYDLDAAAALRRLAEESYGFDVLAYAGGAPLSGELVSAPPSSQPLS